MNPLNDFSKSYYCKDNGLTFMGEFEQLRQFHMSAMAKITQKQIYIEAKQEIKPVFTIEKTREVVTYSKQRSYSKQQNGLELPGPKKFKNNELTFPNKRDSKLLHKQQQEEIKEEDRLNRHSNNNIALTYNQEEGCKRCIYNKFTRNSNNINRCDVGLRSLLRSIRAFFQLEIQTFLNSQFTRGFLSYMPQQQDAQGQTQEHIQMICKYVNQVVKPSIEKSLNNEAIPDYDQISGSLQALLLATRHYIKDAPTLSQLDPTSIQHKTIRFAQLLYMLNIKHLATFTSDSNNIILVKFFDQNRGLEKTDPDDQKPRCRAIALRQILSSIR